MAVAAAVKVVAEWEEAEMVAVVKGREGGEVRLEYLVALQERTLVYMVVMMGEAEMEEAERAVVAQAVAAIAEAARAVEGLAVMAAAEEG